MFLPVLMGSTAVEDLMPVLQESGLPAESLMVGLRYMVLPKHTLFKVLYSILAKYENCTIFILCFQSNTLFYRIKLSKRIENTLFTLFPLIFLINVSRLSTYEHIKKNRLVLSALTSVIQLYFEPPHFKLFRYKTTVSSARGKIVHTETDMVHFDWLLFTCKYWRVNQIWL